jgi:hypothetical protein
MGGHFGRTEHTNGNHGCSWFGFLVEEPSNKPLKRKTSPGPQLAGVTVSSARLRLLGCRRQRDRAWVGDGG